MIYYVEDDANIRELVIYALRQTGFEAEGFADAQPFWKACDERKPELILLDIMLPLEDGLSVLKALKSSPVTWGIPVIMLTAKGQEYDKVAGLDTGADDYITKPFGVMELISRIKAVLRRATSSSNADVLKLGELTLDIKRHTVHADGVPALLTFKEFELLRYLIENKGIVFERERLLDAIWGYDYFGGTRTIDVHIQTLRQKLGECGSMIETVRGVGYRANWEVK